MIGRLGVIAALAMLAGCGGGTAGGSAGQGEIPTPGKVYQYDPDRRHAPVSLSGDDLYGLERRAG
ncbi:MAG TPA: hypothetical protein PLL33_09690 [Paracoccus sp. (in: a-proteobacteria)]|nr:hypothetical protein [Paracoccus sp. (in: a-proteobacteria)]